MAPVILKEPSAPSSLDDAPDVEMVLQPEAGPSKVAAPAAQPLVEDDEDEDSGFEDDPEDPSSESVFPVSHELLLKDHSKVGALAARSMH